MKITIYGLGWYGLPLAESLQKKGHEVSGSVTTKQKAETIPHIQVDCFKYPENPPEIRSDILIINIPPFTEQLGWFKTWKIAPETKVIFVSSTSALTKNSSLAATEQWISTLPHWVILRFGGLYGGQRHPGKHLWGKKNLNGRLWPVNLLHLEDAVGFTEKVIELNLDHMTFNVTSSDHPTREEYYTNYCRLNKLPLPDFDQNDGSMKDPVDNSEAAKIYSFLTIK